MTDGDGLSAGISVVLVDGDPPGEDLVAALGASRAEAVNELKRRRARQWAQAAFPDVVPRAIDRSLTEALTAIQTSPPPGEVVVLVVAELAAWREDVGAAALADLSAGCTVSFGPIFDGGLYLFVLTRSALEPLRAAPPLDLSGRAAMAGLIEFGGRSGLEVGMLQAERGLRCADDVRALLVDPLCDAELRRLLSR